jgi:tetratricopeptide (TPR) repeat protein
VLRGLAEVKNNPRLRRAEVLSLAESTYALRRLRRFRDARDHWQQRLRVGRAQILPGGSDHLGLKNRADVGGIGRLEAGLGNIARAIEIARTLLESVRASKPNLEQILTDASRLSRLYIAVADLERRASHVDRAIELDERRLRLWQHWDRKLPNNPFVLRQIAATLAHRLATRSSSGC